MGRLYRRGGAHQLAPRPGAGWLPPTLGRKLSLTTFLGQGAVRGHYRPC